jgi:hypothetical protein
MQGQMSAIEWTFSFPACIEVRTDATAVKENTARMRVKAGEKEDCGRQKVVGLCLPWTKESRARERIVEARDPDTSTATFWLWLKLNNPNWFHQLENNNSNNVTLHIK